MVKHKKKKSKRKILKNFHKKIISTGRIKSKKKAKKISRKKIKARKVTKQKLKYPRKTIKIKRRCRKCKVPLSGFGYRFISRPLFGVKPSKKKKGLCNKCE